MGPLVCFSLIIMKNTETKDFSFSLERWYEKNQRVLPWRVESTPYHVWLSEIMLQQTRVAAVKERYLRFLDFYPTISSLAKGDIETVNKLWEGLGYYSRASSLLKAAKIVTEKYGGELPKDKNALLSLPGIGEYTSNAILAIAFHEPYIAIDGNLIRIYSRLHESSLSPKGDEIKKEATHFYLSSLAIDPSVFNQALMDLGELVCLPVGLPRCSLCPFEAICKAHRNERELDYPILTKRLEKKKKEITLFIIRYGDSILIRKRAEKGLLASLYEIPNVMEKLQKEEAKNLLLNQGFKLISLLSLPSKKHVFTHLIWDMQAFLVEVSEVPPNLLFVRQEDLKRSFSLPSAFKHYEEYFFLDH